MKLLRSCFLGGVGGLMLSLLYAAPTLAGITLSVQPSSTTVGPNDTFSVAVQVSGLTSVSPREIVRSYDLLLGYDSSLLTAQSIVYGTYLDGGQVGGSLQQDPQVLAFGLTAFTPPYIGPNPPDLAVEFNELSNLAMPVRPRLYAPRLQVGRI